MKAINWTTSRWSIALILLPVGVIMSAMLPVVVEYKTQERGFGGAFAQQCWSAFDANQERRSLLYDANFGVLQAVSGRQAVDSANALRQGRLVLPGFDPLEIRRPGHFGDLLRAPGRLQLKIASLIVADVFLQAYLHSREPEYLEQAWQETQSFLKFERKMYLPRGLVWNDHAIAARVLFLTRLADALMSSGGAHEARVAEIFSALDYSVQRLAKPSQFTFRTNHGVMQSLAVLHVAMFCGDLPSVHQHLPDVARRLERQLEYFITDEGIVREHSSGYQEFGVYLLRWAIQYYSALGRVSPESWAHKYDAALKFLSHITRPDSSTPRYGNSHGYPNFDLGVTSGKTGQFFLSEEYGYWSSWSQQRHHVFMPWANFRSGAHKHADEMSVFFWARGHEWWTGTGYWPYTDSFQAQANSWAGANAPHELGESTFSARETNVVAWVSRSDVEFLHLRRSNLDGYGVDRMLLRLEPDTWIVIDAPSANNQKTTRAVWVTGPGVEIKTIDPVRLYELTGVNSLESLAVEFFAGSGSSIQELDTASKSVPGWIAVGRNLVRSEGLEVNTPPGSWSIVGWRVNGTVSNPMLREMTWEGPTRWTLLIERAGKEIEIRYQESALYIGPRDSDPQAFALTPGESRRPELAASERLYSTMEQQFTRFRDLIPWRRKAMVVLTFMLAVQVAAALVYGRIQREGQRDWFPVASLAGWTGVAVWLHVFYLV